LNESGLWSVNDPTLSGLVLVAVAVVSIVEWRTVRDSSVDA